MDEILIRVKFASYARLFCHIVPESQTSLCESRVNCRTCARQRVEYLPRTPALPEVGNTDLPTNRELHVDINRLTP